MSNEQTFESPNETTNNVQLKKHLNLFEGLEIEDIYDDVPSYDDEFFKPIEFDKPLQKMLYNEADVLSSLQRLKDLVERKSRFNNALARAEQTIRYISGYLKDYDIDVKRKVSRDRIEITIGINVYNGIVDEARELEEIKKALKSMFPDAGEDTIEEAAKRIIENVRAAST